MALDLVQNPKGNWISLRILEGLFSLNEASLRSRGLRQFLWALIKVELFWVGGKCQHSGHCCQKVQIFLKGTQIESPGEWEASMSKNKGSLARFQPVMAGSGQIRHFNCSCLTPDMTCSAYETRPQFCKAYPFSNFVSEIPLYEKCGYHITWTQLKLRSKNRRLRRLVRRIELIYKP